jgi:hypothetical protein
MFVLVKVLRVHPKFVPKSLIVERIEYVLDRL